VPPIPSFDADYLVVGSGAGGGTVAARLAEAGFTVLLLEAGGDPREGGEAGHTNANDYDVPAFHPRATENASMRWDFFVRHYADDARQRRDANYRSSANGVPVDGVLYPRAGTLGGCTAHNAMILICPHDSDWNQLADLTGDASWRAERMRAYFQRLENCGHRPLDRALSKFGINPSGHGWDGWLHTERSVPSAALRDRDLRSVIVESARAALRDASGGSAYTLAKLGNDEGDPNDWRVAREDNVGVRYTPMTTHNHSRVGSRERLLAVSQRYPERLKILTHSLATRVIFDDNQRAVGVEYLSGERLYRAHARPSEGAGDPRRAYASREVILAGGAFNTPQLLMLSGVGPRDQLARHGIAVRVDLPGVGKNLQDRYEVAVVNRMSFDTWDTLRGSTMSESDSQYREWADRRTGVYSTNGALLAVSLRSGTDRPVPDLLCYAVLAKFTGYFPGYSALLAQNPNCLTWAILKGHTTNTAGTVTLRSADPRDPPLINFRYFDEGNDAAGNDLSAVVAGIKFVRALTADLKTQRLVAREEFPGESVASDDDLKAFVRDNAWGHHASCTCPIGAREHQGVLSSDLKVHGTKGLRVVDASVFPRIPGLFIACAVYMVGEKAADIIIGDAQRS
jgi:choline dehydrogenase-like flavoprotein